MYGQVFNCGGCHQFKASQDGTLVDALVGYWPAGQLVTVQGIPQAAMWQLTNGAQVLAQKLILCDACLPQGADGMRLQHIGVMQDGKLSESIVENYLKGYETR